MQARDDVVKIPGLLRIPFQSLLGAAEGESLFFEQMVDEAYVAHVLWSVGPYFPAVVRPFWGNDVELFFPKSPGRLVDAVVLFVLGNGVVLFLVEFFLWLYIFSIIIPFSYLFFRLSFSLCLCLRASGL